MKPSGVITLLSDFGLDDPYVAEMKGVILGLNPKARLVDISHTVAPQQISVAALRLWRAYRHFPRGTVHLAVVDPGVGTSRDLLLAVSPDYFFLAPDNGLLDSVFQGQRLPACYALRPSQTRRTVSATFHGRDRLAPAAALLSLGKAPAKLGKPLKRKWKRSFWPLLRSGGTVGGKIVDVDRFGNLITNIRASNLSHNRPFRILYRRWRFRSLFKTYGLRPRRKPVALIGSAGLLEIALPQGNAQAFLKARLGENVTVRHV